MKKLFPIFLASLLVFSACASEIGRITFSEPQTKEITVNLDASKKVWFWTDLEVVFYDNFDLKYDIDIIQNQESIAALECDASKTDVTMNSTEWALNNKMGLNFTGRMTCTFEIPQSGEFTIKATPKIGGNPQGRELKMYDLIIKQ